MRILVADDSKTIRLLLISLLHQLGQTDVQEADNGQLVCERVAAGGIDMVFLDLHMPVMDGLNTLRKLKESGALVQMPVLIVSSDSDMRKVEEARQLGALGYVRKPFSRDGLGKGLEAAAKFINSRSGDKRGPASAALEPRTKPGA